MTVYGENPGEEYFDIRSIAATGDVQTHVGYITGIGVSDGGVLLTTRVKSGSTSIVEAGGTFSTEGYLIVGGW